MVIVLGRIGWNRALLFGFNPTEPTVPNDWVNIGCWIGWIAEGIKDNITGWYTTEVVIGAGVVTIGEEVVTIGEEVENIGEEFVIIGEEVGNIGEEFVTIEEEVDIMGAGVGWAWDKIWGKSSGCSPTLNTSVERVSGNTIVLLYCSSINLCIWLVSAVIGGRICRFNLAGRTLSLYIGGIIFLN